MNPSRRRRITALATLLLAIAVALFSVAIWAISQSASDPPDVLDLVWLLSFLAFPAVGWLIAVKLPRNPLGWIYLSFPIAAAVGMALEELAKVLTQGGNDSLAAVFMLLGRWLFGLGIMMIVGPGVLLFPNGQLPGRRWRWALWGLPVLYALDLIVTAFGAATVCIEWSSPVAEECSLSVDNPMSIPSGESLGLILDPAVSTLLFLFVFLSLSSLLVRYRRSAGDVRQQIKWVAFVAVVAIGLMLLVSIARQMLAFTAIERLDQVLLITVQAGLAAAIGIAILKYRLYDIDRIISRTASYAILVGILAAAFFASVALTQQLLPIEGQFGIVVSTLVVAALFNPLRIRVQNTVDRRFNRSRYDAQRVLDEFSVRLRDDVDLEPMQIALLSAAQETMQPSYLSIWIRDRSSGSSGSDGGDNGAF